MIVKSIWTCLLVLCLLGTLSASAEEPTEPSKLTLEQALIMALQNSPTLEDYLSRYRESKYAVDEAYAAAYPNLDFSATYSRVEPPIFFPGGPVINPPDNYNFQLTLRQAIFTFGRLRWSTLSKKLAVKGAEENYRAQIHDLIQRIAILYHQALLDQEEVVIAVEALKAQEEALRTAEALYKNGVSARFDVLRERTAVSQARQELLTAETERSISRANLFSELGLTGREPLELESEKDPSEFISDLKKAREQALVQRPELRSLQWAIRSAEAQVKYIKALDRPQFELQNQTVNRNATGFSPGTQNTTSLVLSIPLFDGGLDKARRKQAEEAMFQLERSHEETQRRILLEVDESFHRLLEAKGAIEVAERGALEAEEALRVAFLRYRNSVSTNTELLDTQAAYTRSRLAVTSARTRYAIARWNWWRAIHGDYPVEVPSIPTVDPEKDRNGRHKIEGPKPRPPRHDTGL